MKPESPSPCSKQPAYTEPDESSSQLPILFTEEHLLQAAAWIARHSAGLRAGRSWVRVSAGAGNFSLHHRLQTGSGAHPASYSMGTGGSFPRSKAAEA
jgi:hypothetical protein